MNTKQQTTEPSRECLTCSDHGAVGNILTAEPCPDCTPQESTTLRDTLEMAKVAMMDVAHGSPVFGEPVRRAIKAIDAALQSAQASRECLQKSAEPDREYPPLPEPSIGAYEDGRGGEYPDTFAAHKMYAFADATAALRIAALQAAPPAQTSENLRCKSVQKRLATMWGFVPATAAVAVPEEDEGTLLDYAMVIAHERELHVTGHKHDSDGAVLRFRSAVRRALAAAQAQEHATDHDKLAELVVGMSVSVDVSTGDHDSGNRYFGEVTEVQEDSQGKHSITLLVQDPEPNFTLAAQEHATQLAGQGVEVAAELDQYDAGLLNDFGGGNVEWWQDYIRAELERAHDFYRSQCVAQAQDVQQDKLDAARYRVMRENEDGVSVASTWNGNTGATPYINGKELDKCADSWLSIAAREAQGGAA